MKKKRANALHFRISVLIFSCPYDFSESFRELLDVLAITTPYLHVSLISFGILAVLQCYSPSNTKNIKFKTKSSTGCIKSFPPVQQPLFAHTQKSQSKYPRDESIEKVCIQIRILFRDNIVCYHCGHKHHFNIPPV